MLVLWILDTGYWILDTGNLIKNNKMKLFRFHIFKEANEL